MRTSPTKNRRTQVAGKRKSQHSSPHTKNLLMSKTKVTFLLSRFLDGGIDTVLVQYVNNMDRSQYDVSLIIANNYKRLEVYKNQIAADVHMYYLVRDGIWTWLAKKKLKRKLHWWEKAIEEGVLSPVRRVLQQSRLKGRLCGQDVVVDMDCMFHSFLGELACQRIAFFHFSIPKYCGGKERRIKRLGHKFEAYDNIILVSEGMREEAMNLYPDIAYKFGMIYNPQNIEALQARATEYEVEEEDYILTIARLEESQKDYTTLLRAYRQADDARGGAMPKLRIIGKGPDREALEALTSELGIADKVIFMGILSNPMPWLKKCRAFVLSSKFEGLPVSLVEALSLHVPIIASDCPVGPREILDGGRCGILVPVGDVNAMANALSEITADKELAQRYKDNTVEHSRKFFWEEASAKFNQICENWSGSKYKD